jgi:hypothetical protein
MKDKMKIDNGIFEHYKKEGRNLSRAFGALAQPLAALISNYKLD